TRCRRLTTKAVLVERKHQPAPQIMDYRQSVFGGDEHELLDADVGGESLDGEVAPMHLDDGRGPGSDGAAIVIVVGPVGRPDFDQLGAAARHDVGNPEA